MAPSPTGSPHVGLVRTALYNWAFARHHGGTFVFRIEDTDTARNTQESYDALLDLCGGSGSTGTRARRSAGRTRPYLQSERFDMYADVAARLREAGHAYRCYCTADELDDATSRRGRRAGHLATTATAGASPSSRWRAFEGEGACSGPAVPDARRADHLHRPGARRDHLPGRARARLRAGAGQRPSALHAGLPGRRRADGDHPRAARRGPALLDSAAGRAPRRARARSASATAGCRSSATCLT